MKEKIQGTTIWKSFSLKFSLPQFPLKYLYYFGNLKSMWTQTHAKSLKASYQERILKQRNQYDIDHDKWLKPVIKR